VLALAGAVILAFAIWWSAHSRRQAEIQQRAAAAAQLQAEVGARMLYAQRMQQGLADNSADGIPLISVATRDSGSGLNDILLVRQHQCPVWLCGSEREHAEELMHRLLDPAKLKGLGFTSVFIGTYEQSGYWTYNLAQGEWMPEKQPAP